MRLFKKKNNDKEKRIELSTMIVEASLIPRIDSFERFNKLIGDIRDKLNLIITEVGVEAKKGDVLTPLQIRIYSEEMEKLKEGDLCKSFLAMDEFIMANEGDINSLEKICITSWIRELKNQADIRQSNCWYNILSSEPYLINFEDRNQLSNNVITYDGVKFLEHLYKMKTKTTNFVISANNDISKQIKQLGISDFSKTITLKTDKKINIFSGNVKDEHDRYFSYLYYVLQMIAEYGENEKIKDENYYGIRNGVLGKALDIMNCKYKPLEFGYDKFLECLFEVKSLFDGDENLVVENIYNTFKTFKEEDYFFTGNNSMNYDQPPIDTASTNYFNIEIEDTKMKEIATACILYQIWANTMVGKEYTMIPKHIVAFGVNNYKSKYLCELYNGLVRSSRIRGNSMVTVVEWENEQLCSIVRANGHYTF